MKGLGRGLESLLGVYENESVENFDKKECGSPTEIAIEQIFPNINQPRKSFDENSLKELSDSIKQHGVIQPIILNKEENGTYMIIAGERRFRAAKIAGLKTIPAVIKNLTSKQIREISIIENLQREDLNPIEAARAIKQLMHEYSLTQEIIADRIGKSRPAVTNLLRLLNLHPEVVRMVEDGSVSPGHARCLVVLKDTKDQIRIANAVKEKNLNVRQVEQIVRDILNPKQAQEKSFTEQSPEVKDLIVQMEKLFSTKVVLSGNEKKGKIIIEYFTTDDLDRIASLVELLKTRTLTLKDLNNFNKKPDLKQV